jgi:RNA polymerase sigma-70 factor (ECF subfamily)
VAREPEAFAELVSEIEPRLRRAFIAAFGMDRGHDATAEALAWAWEHWDHVAGMQNPAGYLWRVGRSRSRSARKIPFLLPEPVIEPGLTPALRSLTLRQRTTVLLVHGYGWQLNEVAELLGLKVTTVQSHVDRAMTKLRRAIGEVDSDART